MKVYQQGKGSCRLFTNLFSIIISTDVRGRRRGHCVVLHHFHHLTGGSAGRPAYRRLRHHRLQVLLEEQEEPAGVSGENFNKKHSERSSHHLISLDYCIARKQRVCTK